MGAIKVHEFIALDGVYENPSWTFEFGFDPKMGEAMGAITGTCRAILLGRRTFEMFAPAWSTRTAEEDPGAPFFNESPKYIWGQARRRALSGTTPPSSARTMRTPSAGLKDKVDGDIYVSGSGTLVRAMLADGLVDELHLFVYPVARGDGRRLLGATARSPSSPWLDPRPTATELCISVYTPCHSRCRLTQRARGGQETHGQAIYPE